jgi:hypothetical protein
MSTCITADTLYWADIGDNRVGPLMRELIEALADSGDPHFVRHSARRVRLIASSLESMSHRMAEGHDRKGCPLCKHGTAL